MLEPIKTQADYDIALERVYKLMQANIASSIHKLRLKKNWIIANRHIITIIPNKL